MSDSDNQRNNMSQEDQQPVVSQEQSLSEQNTNQQAQFKKQMIIHKEPNDMRCATYIFNNQDHTLGNLLRVILNGNSDVQFAGYSIPHPSEAKMNLRIQTTTLDTNQILNEALSTIQNVSKTIKEKFLESLKVKVK